MFLLGIFLSAIGAWALARQITGDSAAALLAGLVYAFSPWRMSQIPHIQFQWGAFLPLLLLFLLRYLSGGRRRDLILFAVFLAWNALSNVHYALFSGALVAVVLGFEAIRRGEPAVRRRIGMALVAAAIAGVTVSPFFVPYRTASRLYGMTRSEHETEWFSGRITEFLSAGSRNRLYGRLTQRFSHPEGDFFPGLVPAALAVVAFRRRRPSEGDPGKPRAPSDAPVVPIPPVRRATVRALDAAALLVVAAAALAAIRPGLRLGGLRISDWGRPLVIATALFGVRLLIAFPGRSRYRNLRDGLRRGPLGPERALLLAIAVTGLLVALGLHSPYYRFLFQSAGFVFGAIRAPSRGIVLFQMALGVLAAWGLSRLAGRAPGARRTGLLSAALLLTAFEYRAFPVDVKAVSPDPPPVARWLAGVNLEGGAVVEWPLGDWYDFEYEFRSTAHWQPLVNGYSGFGPPTYHRLRDLLARVPIPDEAWREMVRLGAALVILHPHDAPPEVLRAYSAAIRARWKSGEAELLRAFPHGGDTDYVFRIRSAPVRAAQVSDEDRRRARESFEQLVLRPGLDPSPPLVALDFPPEGTEVRAGEWAWGWALDDSGVAGIRVASELGSLGDAVLGGARPDVARAYRYTPGSESPAFQFAIPPLPPGTHTLTVSVTARDGGTTALRRTIRIR